MEPVSRKPSRLPLFAGLAAMLVGAACLVVWAARYREDVSGGERIPVLVAARDLELGAELSEADLGVQEIPERWVEDRHVPASELDRILGVRVASGVRAGESLLWTDLDATEQRRDLSGLVADGRRALTIDVNGTASLGGLLRPGDRVDVIHTAEDARRRHVAQTILQNLIVLAIGRDTGAYGHEEVRERDAHRVTLAVTLDQATTLSVAQASGTLSLAIRNPEDVEIEDGTVPRSEDDLHERPGALTAVAR